MVCEVVGGPCGLALAERSQPLARGGKGRAAEQLCLLRGTVGAVGRRRERPTVGIILRQHKGGDKIDRRVSTIDPAEIEIFGAIWPQRVRHDVCPPRSGNERGKLFAGRAFVASRPGQREPILSLGPVDQPERHIGAREIAMPAGPYREHMVPRRHEGPRGCRPPLPGGPRRWLGRQVAPNRRRVRLGCPRVGRRRIGCPGHRMHCPRREAARRPPFACSSADRIAETFTRCVVRQLRRGI